MLQLCLAGALLVKCILFFFLHCSQAEASLLFSYSFEEEFVVLSLIIFNISLKEALIASVYSYCSQAEAFIYVFLFFCIILQQNL